MAYSTQPLTFERWLEEEVVPACEEYDRDPSQSRTSEQIRESLAEEYARTQM